MSACDHPDLLSIEAALAQMLEAIVPISETQSLPLQSSSGRVLAQARHASLAVPPADNSAVDGYAIAAADAGKALPISQRIAAGYPPQPLQPGTAARIFTGAEIPPGATAVVMQEDCRLEAGQVLLPGTAKPQQNIRPRGQDIQVGDQLFAAGHRLRPQDLGLLASIGCAEVAVMRPLRVTLLSSGDELVMPGQPLAAGQIYNTNAFTIGALIQNWGMQLLNQSCLADNRMMTEAALSQAARQSDLIISTGGVSVGEEDHMRDAVAALGRIDLWRLAIKPGKPLAFGQVHGVPFIGLPGNPSAAFITCLLLARPLLLKRQGVTGPLLPRAERWPAAFSLNKASIRREFLRVRLVEMAGQMQLQAHPNQSSGALSAACWADGLAVVREHSCVNLGDPLDYYPYSALLN